MFKIKYYLLLIYLVFSLIEIAHAKSILNEKREFFEYINNIIRSEENSNKISANIEDKYNVIFNKNFTSKKIKNISATDLENLFQITREAVFYTKEPQQAENMALIIEQLQSRKKATTQHFEEMYYTYVLTRRIKEAEKLKNDHPELKLSKNFIFIENEIIEKDTPSLWRVIDGNTFERKKININSGVKILLVAHPNCHFSNNAIKDISSNQNLMKTLLKYLILIVPQSRNFYPEEIYTWNKNNQNFPMYISHIDKEFNMIDYWGTPSFYFIKNGILISTMVGWPRGKGDEQISELLGKIKLLSSDAELSDFDK